MNEYQIIFNKFLLQELNALQYKAVTHQRGPLLVVAGAGSGKTRVITARIANLILNENVNPSSIVALTFTNKAAKEMQERIRVFLGGSTQLPFVGTFHSYCLRILKANGDRLASPFISILDADDQQKMLHGIITRYQLQKQTTAQHISYQISTIKNQTNTTEYDYGFAQNPLIKQIFTAYEEEKRASKCLDFDDLLLETLKLFKRHPDFAHQFHTTLRHILVDEYQDTNVVQHELLRCMAKDNNTFCMDSLCIVGDEDQSIYSWRGATIANIIHFKKDFEDTTIIKLEQNYRSVQPILEIANLVIKNNKNRNPKKLWSDRVGSDRIRRIVCQSDYQESDAIAHCISVASRNQKLSSIALLYRTHFQSRTLEEGLMRASIPYKIIGGIQFYERKEIKDLLAYLRLVVNPFDRTSLFRIINCPTRSLGEKFEELFYDRWNLEPFLSFTDLGKKLIAESVVTGAKKSSLISFLSIFDNVTYQQSPSDALTHIITSTQYFSYLKKAYNDEEAQERIDNVKELLRAVNHFETQKSTNIALFLEDVALMQEQATDKKEDKDPVLLMTLHAAKGLEFDTVILAGLEEGLLPSSRSLTDIEKLEEERRLFYVGITRAKERLLLTNCRYRYTYGNMTDQIRSRFIEEIPSQHVPTQELAHASTAHIKQFFANWFGHGNPPSSLSDVITFGKTSNLKSRAATKSTNRDVLPAALSAESTTWKKNQPVSHPTFGIGTIKNIEKRDHDAIFLEIQFKTGVKKIAQQFLKAI